jgi:hypothetical protein
MSELTLHQAQQDVDQWIQTYGVRYFNELTNLGILMEEVGELSRLFTRMYGEQSFKHNQTPDPNTNQTGIDLTQAFQASMSKKTNRDAQRHHNNEKLKDDSNQ